MTQHTPHTPNQRDPFAPYQSKLTHIQPVPTAWLWSDRIPLSGITLLDGDHSTGKSLLALQIAASVSSGKPMPDGTPTIQGGVIIITPHTDALTGQLQLLTDLGANLDHIEILSFIQEPTTPTTPTTPVKTAAPIAPIDPTTDLTTIPTAILPSIPEIPTMPDNFTPTHHPFSIPEDLPILYETIQRLDARLIILDPFITILSPYSRPTNHRLHIHLAALNTHLIRSNVACLLTRSCPPKGGLARPSSLEKSTHFRDVASSRLLIAHDPFTPNRHLLCHIQNHRTIAAAPTCTLSIQPFATHPDLAHFHYLGTHTLTAQDLLQNRPDTLHRRLLSQHLLDFITHHPDLCPIPVTTLYSAFPNSSPSQIQHCLKELLSNEQIDRPARGFYAPATLTPPTPPSRPKTTIFYDGLDPAATRADNPAAYLMNEHAFQAPSTPATPLPPQTHFKPTPSFEELHAFHVTADNDTHPDMQTLIDMLSPEERDDFAALLLHPSTLHLINTLPQAPFARTTLAQHNANLPQPLSSSQLNDLYDYGQMFTTNELNALTDWFRTASSTKNRPSKPSPATPSSSYDNDDDDFTSSPPTHPSYHSNSSHSSPATPSFYDHHDDNDKTNNITSSPATPSSHSNNNNDSNDSPIIYEPGATSFTHRQPDPAPSPYSTGSLLTPAQRSLPRLTFPQLVQLNPAFATSSLTPEEIEDILIIMPTYSLLRFAPSLPPRLLAYYAAVRLHKKLNPADVALYGYGPRPDTAPDSPPSPPTPPATPPPDPTHG
jgi:hypothetical protein